MTGSIPTHISPKSILRQKHLGAGTDALLPSVKRGFLILITQSKQLVNYQNTQNLVPLCPCQGFFRCHHSWTSLPGGCERCDDVCARRDGKQGKDDYKGIGEEEGQKEGLDYNQVGQGEDYHHQCSYECHGWPNQKCKVSQTVFVQQDPNQKL